jgi:hypothetical protein
MTAKALPSEPFCYACALAMVSTLTLTNTGLTAVFALVAQRSPFDAAALAARGGGNRGRERQGGAAARGGGGGGLGGAAGGLLRSARRSGQRG